MPPVEWFLEINGSKTGPYPSEHLLGLLKEGEIPGKARVTAQHLKEQWITVEELARSASRIPERPEIAVIPKSETPKEPDPSHALYETVRKVRPNRDKTGPIAAPSKPKEPAAKLREPRQPVDWKKWGPRAGLALILAALVGFSFWGILQLLKSDSQPESHSASVEHPPQAPKPPFPGPPSAGETGAMGAWGSRRKEGAVPPPTTDESQPELGARLPRPPEATPTQHTDPLELFPRPVEPADEPTPNEAPAYNAPQDYSPPPPAPAEPPPANEAPSDGAT